MVMVRKKNILIKCCRIHSFQSSRIGERNREIDNVEVMIEKEITPQGRISGLTQWKGKKALVIIVSE